VVGGGIGVFGRFLKFVARKLFTKQDIVFRVLRPDENPSAGLFPKNPQATTKLEGFVRRGSVLRTQFIATTRDLNVAIRRSLMSGGRRIVRIDLSKVTGKVFDLTVESTRKALLKSPVARNFAKDAAEVVIEGSVPPHAIKGFVRIP